MATDEKFHDKKKVQFNIIDLPNRKENIKIYGKDSCN